MRPSGEPIFLIAALLLLVALLGPVAVLIVAMSPIQALSAFTHFGAAPLRVSLLASSAATLGATVLGVPAGYYLSRIHARFRAALLFLLALPLAFPPVASGLMLIYVLGPNSPLGAWLSAHGVVVTDSLLGVACAEFFVSGSFVAIAATAAFGAIDPIYADAARTLGVGEWRIFTRIALPGAATGIGAGIAFAWLRAIGEYGATSIVAYHPTSLPVALYVTLASTGVRDALALCYGFVLLAAVALAIAWILRRGVVH